MFCCGGSCRGIDLEVVYVFENVGCGIDCVVCVVFCVCILWMLRDVDVVGVLGRMKGVFGC